MCTGAKRATGITFEFSIIVTICWAMNNYVAMVEIEFAFREIESCFCLDAVFCLVSKESSIICCKPP